jgi:hypothetical protein
MAPEFSERCTWQKVTIFQPDERRMAEIRLMIGTA